MVKKALSSRVWIRWKSFGQRLGDFVGRLVMTVFYFTVAAPFALLIRLSRDPLELKRAQPHWHPRPSEPTRMEDAKKAF